jgi:uncharacterized protein YdeI (BOF family)
MKKALTASLAVLLMAGCSTKTPAEAEPETKEDTAADPEQTEEPAVPADDEIVARIYTLENGTGTDIEELHVYKSKGKNLAEGGMKPGEQIKVDVSGYYLHTPNETLWTVEFTAAGNTYAIRTLHVEDMFNVLYLTGTDETSGATAVSFTNPDGSKQEVEAAETPADDEIVVRTYTLENAMDEDITELYVYKSDRGNLVPDGLKPGEQVSTEVFGYWLHTPNETLYTIDYTADGQQYKFDTLHIEDLFDVLVLKGADAVSGSTPLEFVKNGD